MLTCAIKWFDMCVSQDILYSSALLSAIYIHTVLYGWVYEYTMGYSVQKSIRFLLYVYVRCSTVGLGYTIASYIHKYIRCTGGFDVNIYPVLCS